MDRLLITCNMLCSSRNYSVKFIFSTKQCAIQEIGQIEPTYLFITMFLPNILASWTAKDSYTINPKQFTDLNLTGGEGGWFSRDLWWLFEDMDDAEKTFIEPVVAVVCSVLTPESNEPAPN